MFKALILLCVVACVASYPNTYAHPPPRRFGPLLSGADVGAKAVSDSQSAVVDVTLTALRRTPGPSFVSEAGKRSFGSIMLWAGACLCVPLMLMAFAELYAYCFGRALLGDRFGPASMSAEARKSALYRYRAGVNPPSAQATQLLAVDRAVLRGGNSPV
eukprot:GDKH01001167.1.p1 GENE.GDKH01001167.1~~GDKH01001167.1.p1  ORF type:complete len:159 (+),score=5.51 GDKH01001167.1:62-538(+)